VDFLQLGQHDSLLFLVLAGFVFVAGFAGFVALEEEDLAEALIGVDLGRQRSGIGDFQSNKAFPFGLKGSHVHDNAAAGIGGFPDADGEHVTGNLEVLH
jgi:hypothetical protein